MQAFIVLMLIYKYSKANALRVMAVTSAAIGLVGVVLSGARAADERV